MATRFCAARSKRCTLAVKLVPRRVYDQNDTTVLQALPLREVSPTVVREPHQNSAPDRWQTKSISVKLDDLVEPGDTIVVPEGYFSEGRRS